MIQLEILQRKSLFSLLYKLDQDLAEQTKARRCPFAGVLYIAPTTCESLAVGPLTYVRLLRCALACAAAVRVAGAVHCRPRCGFGAARFTGRRWCCWLPPCARGNIRWSPCSGLRPCAGYGALRLNAGSAILGTFFLKAPATFAFADAFCRRSTLHDCPALCWRVFIKAAAIRKLP